MTVKPDTPPTVFQFAQFDNVAWTKEAAETFKALSEAKAAEANAAHLEALAAKFSAEAKRVELEQAELKVKIEQAKINRDGASIILGKAKREERFTIVHDLYHHSYTFDVEVSERSVKQCIQMLTAWSRDEPGCSIDLYINSPGGSIMDGFALVDFLIDLRAKGHHVRTIALGTAASMAAVILQAGDERVMGSNAFLLIHEGSLGVIGSFGEAQDQIALMTLLQERIFKLLEDRAKPINPKTTSAYLKRQAKRTDWWLDSDEALRLGLVDKVL